MAPPPSPLLSFPSPPRKVFCGVIMKMLPAVWLLVTLFGALGIEVTASPVLGPEDLTIVTHMWAGAADSFGPHALAINEAYAARYGHRLEVVRGDSHAGQRDGRWTKVSVLRELLDVGAGDKGAVLWMDSDAIFSNFNFSVCHRASFVSLPHTCALTGISRRCLNWCRTCSKEVLTSRCVKISARRRKRREVRVRRRA